jgi:hypothetical protein
MWQRPASGTGAAHDRWLPSPCAAVDVTRGCQRPSFGKGQTSSGSSGRSAQPHQTCRPEHRHSARQVRRPSSSRLQSTKPPNRMDWLHSGQAGTSSVMRSTLMSHNSQPRWRVCWLSGTRTPR